MYEGHLPNGSPVQKHSAGELYPVVVIGWGDGRWSWMDPTSRTASPMRYHSQELCVDTARMHLTRISPNWFKRCRRAYEARHAS